MTTLTVVVSLSLQLLPLRLQRLASLVLLTVAVLVRTVASGVPLSTVTTNDGVTLLPPASEPIFHVIVLPLSVPPLVALTNVVPAGTVAVTTVLATVEPLVVFEAVTV